MSMPGLPGMELASSCLGDKKAPGSCWVVVGMRQRSASRGEFTPSSKAPLSIQEFCYLSRCGGVGVQL